MTSWGLIHQALRSMFPKDRYYEGTPLEDFEQTDHGVRSQFCGTGANSVCLADRRGRFAILGETEANFIAFSRLGNFSFHCYWQPKTATVDGGYERMKIYA